MKFVNWRVGELVNPAVAACADSKTHQFTNSPTHQLAGAVLMVFLAALLVSGCARAHAKTVPEVPDAPLTVPPPPPRDIEPADVEPPPPPPPAPEAPRTTPPAPRPRPTPPREQPKPEPPKVDQPAEPPKPAEEAPRGGTTL